MTNREMKHSGVPWLKDIPTEWKVERGKNVLILLKRPVRDNDEVVTCFRDGEVILRSLRRTEGFTMSDKEIGYQGINKGDIVIHGMDGFAGAMGISKSTGKGSPVLVVCSPKYDAVPQYLIYYLRALAMTDVFIALATGIRERSCDLRWNKISELEFILPPAIEQQKIANYLDRKCDEIDAMIALQEKIIEELKAYKQSVIAESVTKGLNPNATMKDSGVEWIGEVPTHWETVKFKSLFNIKKIIAGKLGYDVLSVTQQGLKVKDLSKNEGQIAQDYSKYQIVNIDDFVMNHMDLLTGYIDCATIAGVTSPDYRTFTNRNTEIADNSYYLKIFQKCYKDRTFYHLGQGVSFLGRWRLPKEQLNAFLLPLPPIKEQKLIAKFLENKCTEIDTLISIKAAKIESLKEYKKSIIYEYVTGKKEVTE